MAAASVAPKSLYAHLHGVSGILGKHQDQVLFFSYEDGAIVEVTSYQGLDVLDEAGLADEQAFVDQMHGGAAWIATHRAQEVS
jgi:hypothetical protein